MYTNSCGVHEMAKKSDAHKIIHSYLRTAIFEFSIGGVLVELFMYIFTDAHMYTINIPLAEDVAKSNNTKRYEICKRFRNSLRVNSAFTLLLGIYIDTWISCTTYMVCIRVDACKINENFTTCTGATRLTSWTSRRRPT